MKTNKFNWMAVVLLPLMFLCTACNEDVSEDGVITVILRNGNNGGGYINMYADEIHIDISNNFWSYRGEFVDMGTKSISQIKNIPTQGWASEVAVFPGHGYIFRTQHPKGDELYWDGLYWYGRIYVVGYIEGTSDGGIIGATIQYKTSSIPEVLN